MTRLKTKFSSDGSIEFKLFDVRESGLKVASGADTWEFSGYASKFNQRDSYGDRILPGAYKSIISGIKSGGRAPKMFVNHNSFSIPVGKWVEMSEDDDGLMVRGELTKGNPEAIVVRAALQHGTIDGLSIGYRLKADDFDILRDENDDPMRVIKNISELREVSIVSYPADDGARVDAESIKSALPDGSSISQIERFLCDAGHTRTAAKFLIARIRSAPPQRDAEEEKLDEIRSVILANLAQTKLL